MHLFALVLFAITGLALMGIVGAIVYSYQGGFRFNPHRHIAPPHHPPRAGGVSGVYTSPDLFARGHMTPITSDQGQTNSCCGWAIVEMDTLDRALLYGEHSPAADLQMSGFRPWYYAAGGANVGTTVEDERDALNGHGLEGLRYWPSGGYPDSLLDSLHTYLAPGAATHYDYYQDGGGGRVGLTDVEWQLDHGHPVGLVWSVNAGAFSPAPDGYVSNGGAFQFFHCLLAVQWSSNYAGHGEAVRVWNSWSARWGLDGFAWLGAADFERSIDGAWLEMPGPRIPAWEPRPTAAPTATRRPTPRPTPVPTDAPRPIRTATARPTATRTPTPTPRPLTGGVVVTVRGTNLRSAPRVGAAILRGLAAGERLTPLGPQTTHWLNVRPAGDGPASGWVFRAAVMRE